MFVLTNHIPKYENDRDLLSGIFYSNLTD